MITLVPTDWISFAWGVATGAVALFFTGFLKKAGEDLYGLIKRRISPEQPPLNPKDIELYEAIIKLLPSGLVTFYEGHDFLGAFGEEYWDPLSKFADYWNTPEREFVDKELENKRKELYESALALARKIAHYTSPLNVGLRSVKSDHLPPGPTPDWVKQQAGEINQLTPAFVKSHVDFVRLGRRKLYR